MLFRSWNAQANAGFSEGEKTWLKVNENYPQINVESQESDEDSILNYYKKLIQLRKKTPALIYGDYTDLRPDCNKIWLYTRILGDDKILIMNNFTSEPQSCLLVFPVKNLTLLLSNMAVENEIKFALNPYESRVYEFN